MEKTITKKKSKNGKIVGIAVGTVAAAILLGGVAVITKGFTAPPSIKIIEEEEVDKTKVYTSIFATGTASGERADDSIGMVAGINGEKNDFDNVFPYCEMRTVVDEKENVFTRVPKFYHKIEIGENGETIYSITGVEKEGFSLHPAFIQGEDFIEYFDIGAYEASFTDASKTGLMSKTGQIPAASMTMDNARVLAEAEGYYLTDWRQMQAIQELFVIEFATLDSQSIMLGNCGYTPSNSFDVKAVDEKENPFAPIDDSDIEEDEFGLVDGAVPNGSASVTGLTDGKIGSSYGDAANATEMRYRGIENWYGSLNTWVDGLACIKSDNISYICVSMDARYNSDRDTYKRIPGNDVTNKMNEDGIMFKNVSSLVQDSFTFLYSADTYKIAIFGGSYSDQLDAGAFYLGCGSDVAYQNAYRGFRLSSIPLQGVEIGG